MSLEQKNLPFSQKLGDEDLINLLVAIRLSGDAAIAWARTAIRDENWSGLVERFGDRVGDPAVKSIVSRSYGSGHAIIPISGLLYPKSLLNLADPPLLLFVRGDSEVLKQENTVSIVGSRKGDLEGTEVAFDFGRFIAERGGCVVSGLALGVDGAAHRGALRSGGKGTTVAVMAHGLEGVYPASHTGLADEILEQGGALISEFLPGDKPFPHHFLQRNRIVAALGKVLVVVQAGERSGALVTARLALEIGREVFVVPGSITHPLYRGSNILLRDGATPALSPVDVLASIPELVEKAEVVGKERDETGTREEKLVLKILREQGSVPIDQLVALIDFGKGGMVLTQMELDGRIERVPGNRVRVVD